MVTPRTRQAVAGFDGPLAVLDLDAADRNAAALIDRAGVLPIRVASKSIRVPHLIHRLLSKPGYAGVLAYSLSEALALAAEGIDDIVVAYPTTNRTALRQLAANERALEQITLMVDSAEHLALLSSLEAPLPLRLCIDIDGSLRLPGGVHIGTRRSPVRTPVQAVRVAEAILADPAFRLVGLMCYEGQIAGVGNAGSVKGAAVRKIQAMSVTDLRERRTAIVSAVRGIADLEFVNGGGTGSLESSAAEGSLTEIAAGSGIYSPALFDAYRHFQHESALFVAAPVVRRPGPKWATVFQGGWIASGPAGADRLPVVDWPEGLTYSSTEGPGEVQTPLHGRQADLLKLGDLVFFRPAKAGEPLEHFLSVTAVADGEAVGEWETYRGMGWRF